MVREGKGRSGKTYADLLVSKLLPFSDFYTIKKELCKINGIEHFKKVFNSTLEPVKKTVAFLLFSVNLNVNVM